MQAEAADASATDYTQGLQHRRRILGDAWVERSLANRTPFSSEFQELVTRQILRRLRLTVLGRARQEAEVV